MPRTLQKVTVVVGGGVESKFSVQLRPKLNKNAIIIPDIWLGIHPAMMNLLIGAPNCDYKTNERVNLDIHMELNHKFAPSPTNEDLIDAIEVWKIYKLLQRMKNK